MTWLAFPLVCSLCMLRLWQDIVWPFHIIFLVVACKWCKWIPIFESAVHATWIVVKSECHQLHYNRSRNQWWYFILKIDLQINVSTICMEVYCNLLGICCVIADDTSCLVRMKLTLRASRVRTVSKRVWLQYQIAWHKKRYVLRAALIPLIFGIYSIL